MPGKSRYWRGDILGFCVACVDGLLGNWSLSYILAVTVVSIIIVVVAAWPTEE